MDLPLVDDKKKKKKSNKTCILDKATPKKRFIHAKQTSWQEISIILIQLLDQI